MMEANKNVASAFTSTMDKTPDFLDLSGSKKQIAGIGDQIKNLALPAIAARTKQFKLPDKPGNTTVAQDMGEKKSGPSASRLVAINGYGVFVKDPLLAESRRQSGLLERIAKNTTPAPASPAIGKKSPLVFS